MSKKSDTIAVVTVHGTGDTAASLEGDKWFQRGSEFSQRLLQRLSGQGVTAEIVPHLWTGANSASDRENGANRLAKTLRKLSTQYAGVHVVGHSHGGNVANDAAVLLKWGLRRARREKIQSLTTVGTPFFNIRTGLPQVVAGLLFLVLTWMSAIAFPITAISIAVTGGPAGVGGALVYTVAVGACLWFMFHISSRGVRRILRPRRGSKTTKQLYSIWHENDEAISFLQRVEELPLEPFPRGAMFRGSRSSAIGWGVLVVIFLAVINPLLFILWQIDLLGIESAEDAAMGIGRGENSFLALIVGLLIAPAIFVVTYLAYRYVVGGGIELGARKPLNGYVTGIMRGIAMGKDGDQVLCNVSTGSHTHPTEEVKLTGDVARRMQDGANTAANRLVEKYRWALFTVGGDNNASLTSIATDAMTWDSLIHTTYFDQPEVADMIGDYIVKKVREEA